MKCFANVSRLTISTSTLAWVLCLWNVSRKVFEITILTKKADVKKQTYTQTDRETEREIETHRKRNIHRKDREREEKERKRVRKR